MLLSLAMLDVVCARAEGGVRRAEEAGAIAAVEDAAHQHSHCQAIYAESHAFVDRSASCPMPVKTD